MDENTLYNIKCIMYTLYSNKEYEKFFQVFDEYLKLGYGIDQNMIYYYISILAKTKKYDKAYSITKRYESYANTDEAYEYLAQLYFYCFKPKDAERVLLKSGTISKPILLIKIYMMQGKIDKAKEIIDKLSPEEMNEKTKTVKKQIENYYRKGAFIETEYSCFINNGNELKPGHIVFLKTNPEVNFTISADSKIATRPYMIWKIKGEKIYLFPVTKVCREKNYKLYHQKYPNSIGDRTIKTHLCESTIDNVLTVIDKVLDEDFKIIITSIFESVYFGDIKDDIIGNADFMKEYVGEPDIYDVIEVVDMNTKKHISYLVLSKTDTAYKVIEYDKNNVKIIGQNSELYDKERLIFRIHKLDEINKENLLSQIPKQQKVKTRVI